MPSFGKVLVNGIEITPEAIAGEIQHHPAPDGETAWRDAARALAIREQALGPQHPDTQSTRQSLAVAEERLAGAAPPQTREAQIAAITQQAEDAVATALRTGSAADRAALAAQLEAQAQWAADGEDAGSPYLALAARLRELAAYLGEAL